MKIIVDAMSGDNAPLEIVKGALEAQDALGVGIVLVGREDAIRSAAGSAALDLSNVEMIPASEVVTMDDSAASVMREKKDNSMAVALKLLSEGGGDALVSAGNTGALLVGATLSVKRIRGIRRAALAPVLPTKNGGTLLIDCGANVECTPEYLLQFAYMGHYYAQIQLKKEKPRVGLLNNGEEATKGTDLQKEAYPLLEAAGREGRINFVGNVEGRGIAMGEADVVVCDGFTGNILLKTYEGVGLYFAGEIKKMFMGSAVGKLAGLMIRPALSALKNTINYKEVGGAPLLGISKPVIKAHGSSDAQAIFGAIRQAQACVQADIIGRIEESLKHMQPAGSEAE